MKRNIYDVARNMNLSPGTISKILNGKGNVSTKTRERVLKYVEEIGFTPNSSARTLKSKKSLTIGIVFSDISNFGLEHPFFSSVLQQFKNYIEIFGYEIVFIVNRVGNYDLSYLKWCLVKNVDGVLIVTGNINKPNIIELVNSEIPTVSTDIKMDDLYSVMSDDFMGMKLGLEFALKLGLRKLACVSGPLTSRAFYERYLAFKEILEENNLTFKEKYFRVSPTYGFTGGYNATKELLEEVKEAPDFIFALSDEIAYGVIRALEDSGLKVPEDVSVIGYDDVSFSKHFTPALTTIRQYKKEIGETAAKRLLALIDGTVKPEKQVELIPVSLVIRDSTKKVNLKQ
ncbi:MAG: LacI family DNA-binding transcriptional regulator [Tenericutes bacterium]|nr:LacI family DNA-binding transcriptional regulator [Mycoplasmatota bacterium]